jgi:hypothetical protein
MLIYLSIYYNNRNTNKKASIRTGFQVLRVFLDHTLGAFNLRFDLSQVQCLALHQTELICGWLDCSRIGNQAPLVKSLHLHLLL